MYTERIKDIYEAKYEDNGVNGGSEIPVGVVSIIRIRKCRKLIEGHSKLLL